ncbi:MAG: sugar transferase [Puniceicoccaceae bacterium]
MTKRLLDILLILLSAPVWLVLFLGTALFVLVSFGRPVFFRQERAGLGQKPFHIIKFRTMKDLRDGDGNLLPDEVRLTRCGRVLRSLSLDEFPEILNVLKGDMSLVGPRPLPTKYLPRYSPEQLRRQECLPGITGWAQVNGRNLLNWEDRFRHDVWYVDNRSLKLDLVILWKTVLTVLNREGISAENAATMTEFMGSDDSPDQGH